MPRIGEAAKKERTTNENEREEIKKKQLTTVFMAEKERSKLPIETKKEKIRRTRKREEKERSSIPDTSAPIVSILVLVSHSYPNFLTSFFLSFSGFRSLRCLPFALSFQLANLYFCFFSSLFFFFPFFKLFFLSVVVFCRSSTVARVRCIGTIRTLEKQKELNKSREVTMKSRETIVLFLRDGFVVCFVL